MAQWIKDAALSLQRLGPLVQVRSLAWELLHAEGMAKLLHLPPPPKKKTTETKNQMRELGEAAHWLGIDKVVANLILKTLSLRSLRNIHLKISTQPSVSFALEPSWKMSVRDGSAGSIGSGFRRRKEPEESNGIKEFVG